MKFERHPLIFFLDENPRISAEWLSNRFLEYNIKNCCQVLVCSLLYTVGIRNRKTCQYMFSKDKKTESLNRYFPDWPMKSPPTFVKYTSEESKWCRKCKNHYEVVLDYLEALLDEHQFRYGRFHEMQDMLDFLRMAPMQITLTTGIRMPYVEGLRIFLPWKNLPLKYRKKDITLGYRMYYKSLIYNPYEEYEMTKRDIPEFVLLGRNFDSFDTTPDN